MSDRYDLCELIFSARMKHTRQTNIDILAFFKSGKFGDLTIGKTKEWILDNFQEPADFGIGDTLMNAKIWFYGNIELHFSGNNLILIFSDHVNDLDGGEPFVINKWILGDPDKMKLSDFIENLHIEGIEFTKKTDNPDAAFVGYVRLNIIGSKVQLTFMKQGDNPDEEKEFRLSAFSLM